MEGLIFQSSEFGTDEIYANMEEYIMQITRDNYSQYAQMVQQMFRKKASSNDPLAQCDYGNFSLRFKPVDINFTKPNWDTIMTKRDKPAMSEEEFDEAIKELARKEFATGKRDDDLRPSNVDSTFFKILFHLKSPFCCIRLYSTVYSFYVKP